MSAPRDRARSDWRVRVPFFTAALFSLFALVGGDGPGGAPTGWYAAYFALTAALTAPALFRQGWLSRVALVLGGVLQFYAGLWLLMIGVGLLLMVNGLLALWAAVRPRRPPVAVGPEITA